MAPHHVARLRLLALCVSAGGQAAAYAAVSHLTLTLLPDGGAAADRPDALAAGLALCAAPALLVAPVIGAVAGSRWQRAVLIATSALPVAVLTWTGLGSNIPWLSVFGFLSLGLAIFAATAVATLATLASAARVRMATATLGLAVSAAAGMWVVVAGLATEARTTSGVAPVLAAVSLLAAIFVTAPSAAPAPSPASLVKTFLSGRKEVFRSHRGRSALVGLWVWSFVALSAAVVLLQSEGQSALLRDREQHQGLLSHSSTNYYVGLSGSWFATAFMVGILLTTLNRHPYRHAGFVLYSALLALVSLLGLRYGESAAWPLPALGLALGLAVSPLLNFYLTWTPPKHHGVAAALAVAGGCTGAVVLAAVLVKLGDDPRAARTPLLNALLAVTGLSLVGGTGAFFRPTMEATVEVLFWPIYRIRAAGPGLDRLPARGPYLVIGNHAAWFDPLFLAKVVPTSITPMMTSAFYDLPVIAWLMRHVVGTIRVPDVPLRHEAPELKEAVAALDRGDCVVIFPEGYLRRKEDVPLRRFGRGVWQILTDRPPTAVFACWIDGSWGSYFSYRAGPPTKGKRFDFWRPIRIGVVGPIAVDPATLGDHMATRTFLMRQVSEARRPLGLEPLPAPKIPEGEGERG